MPFGVIFTARPANVLFFESFKQFFPGRKWRLLLMQRYIWAIDGQNATSMQHFMVANRFAYDILVSEL